MEILKLIYTLLAIFLTLIILYARRNYYCNQALKELNNRLIVKKYDNTFYNNQIIKPLLKMQNPFTFKKATIENYFSKQFIDNYLITQTENSI